ncbi:bifunctional glutamate/proline--tRNA ligase-like [Hydractinia symbiolongicarpus]|uniref:bifunctional glutamate/proline--tRNA ligase-like n=1 Tax=Hydractinia symbiolongicarpus TaxID=13093 RepID=UPI00254B45E1|nr:bifunctional glutamate/proline--tRNA ligase-like [Hydractinia symbiolongicarpus]
MVVSLLTAGVSRNIFFLLRKRIYITEAKRLLIPYSTMVSVNVDKKIHPGVVLLAIEHLRELKEDVTVTEGDGTYVKINNEKIEGEGAVSRYLARSFPSSGLYGKTSLEASQVDSWLDFSNLYLKNTQEIGTPLTELNKCLAPSTHLVGHAFTLADFAVWTALYNNPRWSNLLDSGKADIHVGRWFKYCCNQKAFGVIQSKFPAAVRKNTTNNKPETKKGLKSTMEVGGKFFDLPGAEKGKVVVRFPPEASGYLHIGHAKAALMNQYYKELYEGKLIMRFDDTNPAKENAHYEDIILEDIKLLHLTPDQYTRTSDYFDCMYDYAEQLIKQGDAFCDNTPLEEMRKMREERQPSPNRDLSVDENMRLFQEMRKGTANGLEYCLRAKLDYKSDNGCLRDPVLYRCRDEAHLIHGQKYIAYPTYDFACPIVDSIEGVTHALRTSEYLDRDAQFYWILEKLGLRKPYIYSYSRLALINTVLSKRKLTYLVNEGYVDGWNDPRFPTVRGILRRGMTIEGLKEFIVAQGSSKSNVHMEWDKIWSFNKKVIDPIAPRYNALLKNQVIPVTVNGVVDSSEEYPKHPKDATIGQKPVYYSSKILIEGEDAKLMKEGELVTFINWGNLRITKVNKAGDNVTSLEATPELDNKDFKKTVKVTWLAEHGAAPFVPTKCVFFENIIDKPDLTRDDDFKQYINKNTRSEQDMLGDPCLTTLKKGDIIQLQRRGYFICDEPYQEPSRHSGKESPCILFHIPDGTSAGMMNQGKDKTKSSSSSSSKDKGGTSKKQAKKVAAPQKTQTAQLSTSTEHTSEQQAIYDSIVVQGDKIRNLKAHGASKEDITKEVTVLKELKAKYKTATGLEYSPPKTSATTTSAPTKSKQAMPPTAVNVTPESEALVKKIAEQGEKIRTMKGANAPKEQLQPEIEQLLKLKGDYKTLTGTDYQPAGGARNQKQKKEKKPKENAAKPPPKKKEQAAEVSRDAADAAKKQTRLCIEAKKEEALSDWYSQVITKSELIEYYDVSGCYILRPWAFGIWERIVAFFDKKIKDLGVENCYFPMFVSQAALEKEKDHIEDFAPEVAWVTKSGQSELAEPIAIRPTSETVMYPAYAKWIQSYRDLPLRLNQWCNVVRWEFKHPQPFLRTREFLWQEGHSAFAGKEEACEEVYTILGFYAQIYTDLLAIPVVKGRKTEKEKFAGGDFTTTCEAYIQASGRAIQGATSHHLGQNFSKMFGIEIEDPSKPDTKEKLFVYQNSWGLTTRTIGVLVMVHGDNKGLVLPPRVANVQVIIVPVGLNVSLSDEKRKAVMEACEEYTKTLKNFDVRAKCDSRENYSPGWKFNHWELRGVPVRIELGPREVENGEFVAVRRDTGEKITMKKDGRVHQLTTLLDTIQSDMYASATKQLEENLTVTTSWQEFNDMLAQGKIIQAPFCGEIKCEEAIKKESAREDPTDAGAPSMGAKGLCIPFEQPAQITTEKCVHPGCDKPAKFYTLFGRSY